MRAYCWIALSTVAFACGGSAFTAEATDTSGDGGAGDTSEGGSAGVLNRAGSSRGGSVIGSGGKIGKGGSGGSTTSGGVIGIAGDLGMAGDLMIGGSTASGGTAGAAGSAGMAGTGGAAPIDKVCPKVQPPVGGACVNGLVCSYGTDVRTACRPVAKCANGVWSINRPVCEQLHGCIDAVIGKACDASSAKPCTTTEGTYCVCTGCTGAGPCTDQTVWACAAGDGTSGCPKLPPNEGQMCVGETKCGYGSCATSNGASATCDGTTWSWNGVACPL